MTKRARHNISHVSNTMSCHTSHRMPHRYIPSPPTAHHHITPHHTVQHTSHITQHPPHTTTSHHITSHHITQHTTQHIVLVSQLPGMNPAPMPWILWGPGLPPEITGDSAGSTAMTFTVSLTDFKNYTVQYYTVWVSIVLVALE